MQLGKKYTNYPEDKQEKVKTEIQELAKSVDYEELVPLFNTASKKVGTRIATMIALKVLLREGQNMNDQIQAFIDNAKEDSNKLLSNEAKHV